MRKYNFLFNFFLQPRKVKLSHNQSGMKSE